MKFISHRGNLKGRNVEKENSPDYISKALDLGFDVEVDVWFSDGKFFLGHDKPEYPVEISFISDERLWCHAKNLDSLLEMLKKKIHCFWHETDKFTMTSKNIIWAYPTQEIIHGCVAVLPELHNQDISRCYGICSDFILNYKNDKTYNF